MGVVMFSSSEATSAHSYRPHA